MLCAIADIFKDKKINEPINKPTTFKGNDKGEPKIKC